MIEQLAVLRSRILQELAQAQQIVNRVERAMNAAAQDTVNQDLLLDSVALNMHDYYSVIERVLERIASVVDRTSPRGFDWHRELLSQMTVDVPDLRPPVISPATAERLDEFLRFRHVVRNVYAFELDRDRIERLVGQLRPTSERVTRELQKFADLLKDLARQA
ncbi:MAG: hypothetical protein ACKVVP_04480 [Chloroflexota bacterium]